MPKRNERVYFLGLVFSVFAAVGWSQATPGSQELASNGIPRDRMQQYADLAVQWQQRVSADRHHESSRQ